MQHSPDGPFPNICRYLSRADTRVLSNTAQDKFLNIKCLDGPFYFPDWHEEA
jgi:hypothetical protein